jgi:hypothetical protein
MGKRKRKKKKDKPKPSKPYTGRGEPKREPTRMINTVKLRACT